jgi:glycosyltransferase involved in cell wall biosynthesis
MGARGLFEVRKLIRLIRENHIDIMHAHGARVNLWGSLASLCTGVPIISTEHNIDLWRDNGFIFELIDRLSQKVNKYRVGVSQAVCKMLLESGMPEEKVKCIDNGIEMERFLVPKNIDEIKNNAGIKADTRIIGTVGRLVEQKGHKYLIQAARNIVNKFSYVKFLIVGDGPLRSELEALAESQGLGEKINFAGQRSDIPELLAMMDIFILPSITEGLPLVILEAMASERPVIATRVSGIPFVIKDGVDGLLCNSCDVQALVEKMENLLTNKELADKLGRNGKEKALSKYRAEEMINNYSRLYMKITEGKMEK